MPRFRRGRSAHWLTDEELYQALNSRIAIPCIIKGRFYELTGHAALRLAYTGTDSQGHAIPVDKKLLKFEVSPTEFVKELHERMLAVWSPKENPQSLHVGRNMKLLYALDPETNQVRPPRELGEREIDDSEFMEGVTPEYDS